MKLQMIQETERKRTMGYRKVKPEIKSRAIGDLLRGESIVSVSRRYEVSRSAIYKWLGAARQALEEYFSGQSGGKDIAEKPVDLARKEKVIQILEERLRKQAEETAAREREVATLKDIARPNACQSCGCEKIYKVGYYEITPDYFIHHLAASDRKIKVLHFTCAACRKSYSVVDPFHNIFMLSPEREEGENGDWTLTEAEGEMRE